MPSQIARQHPTQIAVSRHCTQRKTPFQPETRDATNPHEFQIGNPRRPQSHYENFGKNIPVCLPVLLKLRPKLLRQKLLLAPRLDIKRQPHDRHRNQPAHLSVHNRTPQKTDENPCIDRMPYIPVRPRSDQFVSFLQRHDPAPVRPQMHPRPNCDRQSHHHDRHAGPLHLRRVRHKVDPQTIRNPCAGYRAEKPR